MLDRFRTAALPSGMHSPASYPRRNCSALANIRAFWSVVNPSCGVLPRHEEYCLTRQPVETHLQSHLFISTALPPEQGTWEHS
ncbi:hypothetical protein CCHR01_06248 [Colletotrichum chrysophilum]|uniref:Uncharacterized protein n=1 Tax=Colletotrichum chrysophilum TaxID=1836956 RepID=A0AAD9AQ29_9PEZI|nr:hypothetical protein CCHR01_06248 [Colletotrichum chrysophilum]